MFTGIIESLGIVKSAVCQLNGNLEITIASKFSDELVIGQSIAHNGVCLTVTTIHNGLYTVTAIEETLNRTNLSLLKVGDEINLERCMVANGRFDGHIVQGHVDTTGICEELVEKDGSKIFYFSHPNKPEFITVDKGSICINGASLTVVSSSKNIFSVAIIPHTLECTNLKNLQKNMLVNLEFDVLGKYLYKISQNLS